MLQTGQRFHMKWRICVLSEASCLVQHASWKERQIAGVAGEQWFTGFKREGYVRTTPPFADGHPSWWTADFSVDVFQTSISQGNMKPARWNLSMQGCCRECNRVHYCGDMITYKGFSLPLKPVVTTFTIRVSLYHQCVTELSVCYNTGAVEYVGTLVVVQEMENMKWTLLVGHMVSACNCAVSDSYDPLKAMSKVRIDFPALSTGGRWRPLEPWHLVLVEVCVCVCVCVCVYSRNLSISHSVFQRL